MNSLTKETRPHSLPDAITRLRAALTSPLPSHHVSGPVRRAEIALEPLNPLAWLSAQTDETKFFWQDRGRRHCVAAIGKAQQYAFDSPAEIREVQDRIRQSPQNLRYYGGMSFQKELPTQSPWEQWGYGIFILPRVELVQTPTRTVLACQALNSQNEINETLRVLDALQGPDTGQSQGLTLPINRLDTPSQLLWEDHVRAIIEQIKRKECQKVVLARQVKLEFAQKIDPMALLAQLVETTSNCFCFLLQTKDMVFLGASPERLYRRSKDQLETEAVAGTRPKAKAPKEDLRLQNELQRSRKDLAEQGLVIEMIQDTLLSLCEKFTRDTSPALLNWSGGHHLITGFSATLKNNVTDDMILTALHPTPAVAGTPTAAAVQLINTHEPFARGWYTGPIGYLGRNESEFAVGIRCGLIDNKNLWLYAGAGIVEGSSAASEWQETENKLINFLKIFQAHD